MSNSKDITKPLLYPIGIQSFEKLRREGFLYVDKTALVYKLAQMKIPFFFSRPRRFGKSLLLSTIEAYYQGKKELFEGLAIEQLEKDWNVHPVLHLSLNAEKYDIRERLENILERQLENWEILYETGGAGITYSGRFMAIIKAAYEKTGSRVVVLIDEYDKPLLRSMHDEKLQADFRETLTAFYTVLKDADPWLHLVFITGVTKFAQVGIFSNLNQLYDISLNPDFATICGLTREEIETTFPTGLQTLAEANNMTYDEVMSELTKRYDGYHFSYKNMTGMFNPFSVLHALSNRMFGNYWFASGTPTFLAEILTKTDYDLRELEGIEVSAASLSDDRANVNNPIPMIYQSGYLTIKDYDEEFQTYTLCFPNEEVKYGFLNFVSPFYTCLRDVETPFYVGQFVKELRAGKIGDFLTRMRAFFADFPYELNNRTEKHYQIVFYLIFKLMGQFTLTEVRSAIGRADAVVWTPKFIYVFEFKLDGSAEDALKQIDDKGYLIPYTVDERQLVKVGVNFDAETRNLGDWRIQ